MIWTFGLALIAVFSLRPPRAPAWLWSTTFASRYLVGVMASITLWSLSQSHSPPMLGLGGLAALAAGSAFLKWNSTIPGRKKSAPAQS
jgi:hypothetical protein